MEEEDTHNVETELEDDPHYNPPPEKSIDDILAADKEDASLQQYKATLLGTLGLNFFYQKKFPNFFLMQKLGSVLVNDFWTPPQPPPSF